LFKVAAVLSIRHYLSREQFGLSVNKCGYIGVFTGTFYGVSLPGLLFNDFRAFIDGDTVNYLPVMAFCPLPLARFCLFMPEMLFQPRVFSVSR
jgi:hypothetical protein